VITRTCRWRQGPDRRSGGEEVDDVSPSALDAFDSGSGDRSHHTLTHDLRGKRSAQREVRTRETTRNEAVTDRYALAVRARRSERTVALHLSTLCPHFVAIDRDSRKQKHSQGTPASA
jgi:hypothetical protein